MDDPFISSDAHAWLRPIWADLTQDPSFDLLTPAYQALVLAAIIAPDYPAKAQEIREWNAATRRAMLASLDMAVLEGHTARETEVWRARQGNREVRCVAVYLPTGLDLRLLDGGEMLRTVLCGDPWSLKATARAWLEEAVGKGWADVG